MVQANAIKFLITITGLIAFIIFGCGGGGGESESESESGAEFEVLLYTVDTEDNDQTRFSRGNSIKFELNITNLSDSSQTLSFNSSQIYDFVVRQEGVPDVIWQWSHNANFTTEITNVTFDPGETQRYTVQWDQTANNGQDIDTGQYEVQVTVSGYEHLSTTELFEIAHADNP